MSYFSLKGKKIIFFGDSVTDTCKSFNKEYPYGSGYVNIIRGDLHSENLYNDCIIYNEGISGNKTEDLLARINDVLEKNPDLVFLLIGINDVWHPYEAGNPIDFEGIICRFDLIIKKLQSQSKVIVLTPFLFPTDDFFKSLKPYFDKFRQLQLTYLKENNIDYIDTYLYLQNLSKEVGNLGITKDSVHPTVLGHGAIAQCILDYLKDK